MTKPVISIGNQDFEFIRANRCFYIDKTGWIKEWWENQDAVTLITRPRRFGKTLNLSMMNYFFSNLHKDKQNLFADLSIWKEKPYRDLQGSYPVIFLSFADIKGATYEAAREGIVQILTDLYKSFRFLTEDGHLDQSLQEYFTYIQPDMSDTMAAMCLKRLSICLHQYYGKKVLIFLDEYDTPLQEAYVHGYWEEMAAFIRSLFNSTFKMNPCLERAIMTGITRVSKESIFSDLNNLTVITTTSEKYRTQFGFLESEVSDALEAFGIPEEQKNVARWYDGFTFGSQSNIYNPWSITNFLEYREYRPYWANSSSNVMISRLIRQGDSRQKSMMEDLLSQKVLTTEIDEEIIFSQLSHKQGAIFSLLLASGYLKVVQKHFEEDTGRYLYDVKIPNQEVTIMFTQMIREWFSQDGVPYQEFIAALLKCDVTAMNQYMNKITAETFSFFDTGRSPSRRMEPERFFHGFVLGLIAELTGKYRITSNRESGYGRYDLMMEPTKKNDPAFIFEFKVHDPKSEASLEETLAAAQAQIIEKDYDRELLARGFTKAQIHHYGFVFEGKNVLIG